MHAKATPLRHARLMHGMAEKIGLDLESEPQDRLPNPERAAMTTRCDACTNHDACILWMLENDTGAKAPPAYCPNAQAFGMLKG